MTLSRHCTVVAWMEPSAYSGKRAWKITLLKPRFDAFLLENVRTVWGKRAMSASDDKLWLGLSSLGVSLSGAPAIYPRVLRRSGEKLKGDGVILAGNSFKVGCKANVRPSPDLWAYEILLPRKARRTPTLCRHQPFRRCHLLPSSDWLNTTYRPIQSLNFDGFSYEERC